MRRTAFLAVGLIAILLIAAGCPKKNPSIPVKPIGNAQTFQYVTENYRTMSEDPGKKDIRYVFNWGDKTDTTQAFPTGPKDTANSSHAWTTGGTYQVKVLAVNADGLASADWSDALAVTVGANDKPNKPDLPTADPVAGTPKDEIIIWTKASDPNGDSVRIRFFSDLVNKPNENRAWRGPVPSGTLVYDTVKYTSRGDFKVAAIAQDIKGGIPAAMSETSAALTIPIGPYGIGWRVYSDNSSSFFFPPAIAVTGVGQVSVYGCSDGDSIYIFKDNGGSRPGVSRGSFAGEDASVPVDGPTISADGQRVYVPCDDGKLYVLTATSVNEMYTYQPDTAKNDFTMPAVNGGNLYCGRGETLYSMYDDGSRITRGSWAFNAMSEVSFPPALSSDGSKVFFGNDTGVFCVNTSNGSSVWPGPFKAGGALNSAMAIDAAGIVWAGCGDLLYGLDPNDGHVVYSSTDTLSPVTGAPVIGPDGTVYAARENGDVFAFRSGSVLWSRTLPSATINAAPCLAPDTTLIVHTDEDMVYALDLNNQGNPVMAIQLPVNEKGPRRLASDIGCSPTIAPGMSRIYVGSNSDPFFYAITVDKASFAAGLPTAPWPKFQHDMRNSGFAGGWVY